MLKFTILGEPKAKQSFRFSVMKNKAGKSFVHKYQSKKIENKEQDIRVQVISQLPKDFKIMTKPIWVKKLHFYFYPPKRILKNKRLYTFLETQTYESFDRIILIKETKPDHDNLEKMVWDSMQGKVFVNDCQISAKDNFRRHWGLKPRIEIELEEIE